MDMPQLSGTPWLTTAGEKEKLLAGVLGEED
jgi:hypothetical protein